jgi:hypothetical protein
VSQEHDPASHEYYCTLDEDGHCLECLGRLGGPIKAIVEVYQEFARRVQEPVSAVGDICEVCARKNLDYMFAKLLRDIRGALPAKALAMIGKAIIQNTMQELGIETMPLTEKVIRDLTESA